jgi:hypothetical protein
VTSVGQPPAVPGLLAAPGSAGAYANAVLASGPALYWKLNDAVGATAPVESVQNLPMTVSGAPTFATSDPWGGPAACHFSTSAASCIFNTNYMGPLSGASFSIEAWARPTAGFQNYMVCCVSGGVGDAMVLEPYPSNDWYAMYFPTGLPLQHVFSPKSSVPITSDGNWHHWCWTRAPDGGTFLYFDGVAVSNNLAKVLAGAVSVSQVSMGTDLDTTGAPVAGHWYNGDLCHVALYARPLSAREVQTHYLSAPPATACVRQASLVAGPYQVQLDNPGGGWACQSLDLGSLVPRVVSQDRPDTDGAIDRTAYMSGRTVTVAITAVDSMSSGLSIDSIAAQFAQFALPGARPVLHYVLDRPGAPERTLTLRPANYDWPIAGAVQRDIALQWVAPDPIARDVVLKSTMARIGTNGSIVTAGDVGVRPQISLYGPVTTGMLTLQDNANNTLTQFGFVSGYVIAAGHRVDIDANLRTAYVDGDKTQNASGSIDWSVSSWPYVAQTGAVLQLTGTATSAATRAVATWFDGFVS